jgi:hypothetical protein
MDKWIVDVLVKRPSDSRRKLLGGGVSALVGLFIELAGASAKKKKRKKKHKNRKHKFCRGTTKPCGTTCIPVDRCCANVDCGDCESCVDGVCQSGCFEGQSCENGLCTCSPASCDGCCADDTCWGGRYVDYCGTGGQPCVACTGGMGCEDDGVCRCSLGWRECRGVCISDTHCCTDDQCANGRKCAGNGSCATACPAQNECPSNCSCAAGPDPDLPLLCYDMYELTYNACNKPACNQHSDCWTGYGCVSTHCGDVPINRCIELCSP